MHSDVLHALRSALGTAVVSDQLVDRLALSRDASLYRMVPYAVVRPTSVEHIVTLFDVARRFGTHCTFRAAGTSLSGQAVTDGILVDISRAWKGITVLDDGARLRVQPGITGGRANAVLRRYRRRIGPDPASLIACMVGGIVANNASGMCCGTTQNSYHTIDSIRFVLPDGTIVDTADQQADTTLAAQSPDIATGIVRMRDAIRANPDLVARIRRKYRIKNTVGYGLNAFLDADGPAAILGRLMVGSEGTLGFIDDVVFRTVPDASVKHTAVLVYASIEAACDAVPYWREQGTAAVELMDDASMRSFASLPTTPEPLRTVRQGAAALLVEMHDVDPPTVDHDGYWTGWTSDPAMQATLWHLRKGLMPTIGAMRPAGSTIINEDVAVPPERLAELVRMVQQAFREHGYTDGIIFGHAKDGNIHFIVHQRFDTDADVRTYVTFMDRIAAIVTSLDGSLKAEHGTGRNMAPYVEQEWGSEAYAMMQQLKTLVDPHGILNPGVILNDDPEAHAKHIKPIPVIEASVDTCIECGFCEHVCPTRDHSLTPRQRIALRRELVLATDADTRSALADAYQTQGVDTCVVDGMCATVCPVGIDTGALTTSLRADAHGAVAQQIAGTLSRHFTLVDTVARAASATMHLVGSAVGRDRLSRVITRLRRVVTSVPQWYRSSGRPVRLPGPLHDSADLYYLPACGSRWMGERHGTSTVALLQTLCDRAGLRLHRVADTASLCCGQIFDSKGLSDAAATVRGQTASTLRTALPDAVPVIVDASTCAAALVRAGDAGRPVLDIVGALHQVIMPRLTVTSKAAHVGLHPGCGTAKLRQHEAMMAIAEACADRVTVPTTAGCCGMAGDAGMRMPDVVTAALRHERAEILAATDVEAWYSVNTTCEIALEEQTGRSVQSLLALVEAQTRPLSV